MKNFNFNNKRFVYSSCLMMALVGLTSFNPFSQETHLTKVDNKEGSKEFASLSAATSISNSMLKISSANFTQRPFGEQNNPNSQGTSANNSQGGRGARHGGNAETATAWSGETSPSAGSTATFGDAYATTEGTQNEFELVGNKTDAIGDIATDRSHIYVTRIQKIGNTHRVTFKIDPSQEAKNRTLEAGVCRDEVTCENYNNLLSSEQTVDIANLDINALTSGNGSQQITNAVLREYENLTAGYAKSNRPHNRPFTSAEGEEYDECTDGEYTDRNKCLTAMKKNVCKRREKPGCIPPEVFSDALQTFIEDVTLDPDVSDRLFARFTRLASKDREASQLVRLATQYRRFKGHNEHFAKNIDRTMDRVNSLDNEISKLDQHSMNPMELQEQRRLAQERSVLIMQIEKEVEGFKNHYQSSTFASTNVNGRGEHANFTQSLRTDLELNYSETVAPISNMFFDSSLATLDRSTYAGINSGSNNFTNRPFGQNQTNGLVQTGVNTQGCVGSNDPRCSNGYSSFGNQFGANNQFGNQFAGGQNYNSFDPRMANPNQTFINRPFGQGQQMPGQFSQRPSPMNWM